MKGTIFNIQRFSTHDGPGIRTTVFFKGCPLKCHWCCNPEGQSFKKHNVVTIKRIGDKEFERPKTIGQDYSVEELMEEIKRDSVFFEESQGGVTFSGGEPTAQPEFLLQVLKECKKSGIHTALDTEGYFKPELIDELVPYVDLFLFDLKHMDPDIHMKYTGVANHLILDNYKQIAASGANIMARMPIIPTVNDSEKNLLATAEFIVSLISDNFQGLAILPYHPYGESKYEMLKMEYKLDIQPPPRYRMEEIRGLFQSYGIPTKIGG